MDLKKLSDKKLIEETTVLVKNEKRIMATLLDYFTEINSRRLYADYGYSSLFKFLVKFYGYSESQAQLRVQNIKLIKQVPEVAADIVKGNINLNQGSLLQSFFENHKQCDNDQEKKDIINNVKGKSVDETKKILKGKNGKANDLNKVTLKVNDKVYEKWQKTKGLLAHKKKDDSDLFNEICDYLIEHYSPVHQNTRPSNRQSKNIRYISPDLRKKVWQRADCQCEYVDAKSGRRCDSTYLLEIEHSHPVGLGGETSLENLRLLCKNHNTRAAIKTYGREKMERYLT